VRDRRFEDAIGVVSGMVLPEHATAERDEICAILLQLGERRAGRSGTASG